MEFKGAEYLNPAHLSYLIITEMELHYSYAYQELLLRNVQVL